MAWCQLRVWTLEHFEHLKRQGIKARNFLPSYYHVFSFKKHKACVVWLPWTLWAGGRQNGSQQHQSSCWHFATKNIFQRRTLLCVDDTWNGIFFLQDTDLIFHSLQMVAAATDSVDSWKFLSAKKSPRKSGILCSIVSSDSATFVTCSQLWCWWSQIKQVISAPWRPTTPCCLFPCTKMVKLFPFKGNKSWCSSWDRKTARTKSK